MHLGDRHVRAIVALGNPGPQYEFTRHNYGWLVADQLEDRLRVSSRRETPSYKLVSAAYARETIVICKPQTYMNLSGVAVDNLMREQRIDLDEIVVLHDDLDIPFGSIRLKSGGGHGGHKGLISIIRELGRGDFLRLRLGIGRDPRPPDTVEYVLQAFDEDEMGPLEECTEAAVTAVLDLTRSDPRLVMNRVNRRPKPPAEDKPPADTPPSDD